MGRISIDELKKDSLGKEYEGYLWLSNSEKPKVYKSESIDLKLEKGTFFVEGQLYCRASHVSYSIRYVDGEHIITEYENVDGETTDNNIEHKVYYPNRMDEFLKERMGLHFLRYWEEMPDENCKGDNDKCMPVLVITKNVFVGFKKMEE